MPDPFKSPGPLTLVRWKDHFQIQGWHDKGSPDTEPVFVSSVGYLVAESDEMIVLQNHIAENGTKCLDSMSILQADIVERWEVECG